MVLEGFVFCATGLDQLKIEILEQRILKLKGTLSRNLTKQVTHLLIAKACSSQKYLAAKKNGISIIQLDFIEDCWTRSRLGVPDVSRMLEEHRAGLFCNLYISCSGIMSEERERIARVISGNGASYCANMTAECDILLIPSEEELQKGSMPIVKSNRSSPKISFAIEKKIPIIDKRWFYECVESEKFLPHGDYIVPPTHPSIAFAVGHEKSPIVAPTQSYFYNDISLEDIKEASHPYHQGCHFYIANNDHTLVLKRMIVTAGGIRHSTLFDHHLITHYLVHNQRLTGEDQERLRQFDVLPLVVHDQWLFACWFAGDSVDIGPFLINASSMIHANGKENTENGVKTQPKLNWSALKNPTGNRPANISSENISYLDSQLTVINSPQQESIHATPNSHSRGNHLQTERTFTTASALPLFSMLKFQILFFDSAEFALKRAEIIEMIEQRGGIIIDDGDDESSRDKDSLQSTTADYFITPITLPLMENVDYTRLHSQLWLERCISENEIINEITAYNHPFPRTHQKLPNSKKETMLMTLSGYKQPQKAFLEQLANVAGITITQNLTRHHTHLMCLRPSGPKWAFAKRFESIQIVDCHWLLRMFSEDEEVIKLFSVTSGDDCEQASEFETGNQPTSTDRESKNAYSPSQSNVHPSSLPKPPPSVAAAAVLSPPKRSALQFDSPLVNQIRKEFIEHNQNLTPTNLTQSESKGPSLTNGNNTFSAKPLAGFIFSISQRLWHRREELGDLVGDLGGIFIWSYDASCTHYIHQGNMKEESFREFAIVRAEGKWMVSPHWLIECKRVGRRVKEADYPHTYDPNNPPQPPANWNEPSAKTSAMPPINRKLIQEQLKQLEKQKKPRISYDLTLDSPIIKSDAQVQQGNDVAADEEKMVLVLTGCSASLKARLDKKIAGDGAVHVLSVQSNILPQECTHLIAGSLGKNEKLLTALARCIPVIEAARFIDSSPPCSSLHASAHQYPISKYWEGFRERKGHCAFGGWTVLLFADQKRGLGCERILLAGGARVERKWIDNLNFTHVLISSEKMLAKELKAVGCDSQSAFESRRSKINNDMIHPLEYIQEYLFDI